MICLTRLKIHDFEKKMSELDREVGSYLIKMKRQFDSSLDQKDFSNLRILFDTMKILEISLITKDTAEEFYQQMNKSIRLQIKSIENDFSNNQSMAFLSDRNLLEKDFDSFFEKLNKKQETLKNLSLNFKVKYLYIFLTL